MDDSLELIVNLCSDITCNSKEVKEGVLFIAAPGKKFDGRDYIAEAICNGATAIIYESKDFNFTDKISIPCLGIENLHEKYSKIIKLFYGNLSESLKIIGITGTNGKTSLAGWLSQSLNLLNNKTAMIGTLGYEIPGRKFETSNTTPDAISLSKLLNHSVNEKCVFTVMEVSSHAIKQKRIKNIDFDLKILTNVTRDHLDYHKTIKEYQNTKKQFFLNSKVKKIIINIDDLIGREILEEARFENEQLLTYAIDREADIQAKNIVYENKKMTFNLCWKEESYQIKTHTYGRHNIYNLLGVIACLIKYDFSIGKIIKVIENLQSINGRYEVVHFDQDGAPKIIIDYAHTPDALENILQSLGELHPSEIILIFGCGGDRDKGKRKEMALIANKYANKVIITNDNPRDENPLDILNTIKNNLSVTHEVIENREEAIKKGLKLLRNKSILLIAGKGHENYQEIKGVKIPFSDKEITISNISLIRDLCQ